MPSIISKILQKEVYFFFLIQNTIIENKIIKRNFL
nr:MAG TPA: hypothetical protein [Caudoviricetes sp.]